MSINSRREARTTFNSIEELFLIYLDSLGVFAQRHTFFININIFFVTFAESL